MGIVFLISDDKMGIFLLISPYKLESSLSLQLSQHTSAHIPELSPYTVNSRYLKVEVHPKLMISQSKFSSPRKFTLRYQQFEIIPAEMKIKIGNVSF